jgi:Uncharacterised nucleotidyltransferase
MSSANACSIGDSTGIAGGEILSLLQLLRTPASGDFGWVPGVQWDWRPLAAACDTHQIAPLIFCRLRDLPQGFVPSGLLEYLRARFYEVSARNYHLANKLVELTSFLEGHDIPALAYKGPAVAMAIYGDLALRQYEDLDLVIPKEHLARALDLMTQRGFRIMPYPSRGGFHYVPYSIRPENPKHLAKYHVVTLQAPDKTFFVDLHWHLANEAGRAFCPDIEKVWDRAERLELPQGSVSTFCREDLLLALCYHGIKHRWSCLKWLLDVAELFRKSETLDWSRIHEMTADRPGAGASAALPFLLTRELLGVTVVPEVAKALPITPRTARLAAAIREEILLQGCTEKNDHVTLLKLEGSLPAWMKLLCIQYPGWWLDGVFGRVSPKDRAVIALPETLQFLYHFIRPARLAIKYAWRAVSALWSFALDKKSFEQRRAT